jgi:hypothetical protein
MNSPKKNTFIKIVFQNIISSILGFDGKVIFAPYKRKPNQKVTEKKMNKSVVKKGKIKDLKK